MTSMPPRSAGLEGIPLQHDGVVVGMVPVRGVGFRVGLQGAGQALIMSPAKARRMAPDWRSPEAKAAGLDWIADALEEAANDIDAMPAAEQIQRANEMWAAISATGSQH